MREARFFCVGIFLLLGTLACSPPNGEQSGEGDSAHVDDRTLDAYPKVVVESALRFVTWGDVVEDQDRNPVGVRAAQPAKVILRYNFNSDQRKFMRVLDIRARWSCGSEHLSEPRVTLKWKNQEKILDLQEIYAFEPQTDYVLEIRQVVDCKEIEGALEAIVWTGRVQRVDASLARICLNSEGEEFTVLGAPSLRVVKPQKELYIGSNLLCGQSTSALSCSKMINGNREDHLCRSDDLQVSAWYEDLSGTGEIRCERGDEAFEVQSLQNCRVQVLDRNDFPKN